MALVTARAHEATALLRRAARNRWLVASAFALVALAPRVTTLGQPLLEAHPWRQTWTAWGALAMSQTGIDLFRAPLPIFGPPWTFPQEFPITQAVGSLLIHVGLGADLAMRVLSLAAFLLCSWLLYRFVADVAGRSVAVAAWAVFVFSPYSVVWSRTSLVEYPALAGALAYAWLGVRWRRTGDRAAFAIALAAGTIAVLIKPTGAVFAVMPIGLAAVATDTSARRWLESRLRPPFLALCMVPAAIGLVWTAYVDRVVRADSATAFLAPGNVRDYYVGTLADRSDVGWWQLIGSRLLEHGVGYVFVPALAAGVVLALRGKERWLWVGVLLAGALPVLVFFGGFRQHDYYLIQIVWVAAAFTALALAWLWEHVRVARHVPLVVGLAVAALIVWQTTGAYWHPIYSSVSDPEGVLPVARDIAAATRPDESVVMVGRGHDPDALYYAGRRGLLLTQGNATLGVLQDLRSGPYTAFASWAPANDAIDLQMWWPWAGALNPHTYAVGSSPTQLRGSPLLGTDDVIGARDRLAGARSLLPAPLTLRCDAGVTNVPVGQRGTWLFLRRDVHARLSPSVLYAPMPGWSVLILAPAITFARPTTPVLCFGAAEVVIEAAFDAPPP